MTTARASTAAAHAAFKGRMTKAVVGCLLLGILEDFISLVRFFELCFGVGVVSVAVWMQLFRLLAIGFLDLSRIGPFGDTKRFVVIAFCHDRSFPSGKARPARVRAGLL